uniref:hydroxyethylthiazole kinase n=1 Tax=Fagus sylvatica TaxID=28930 RepID=A0A2N9F236_FAGSY
MSWQNQRDLARFDEISPDPMRSHLIWNLYVAVRDLAVELDVIGPWCGCGARRDVWRWRSDHAGDGDRTTPAVEIHNRGNERGKAEPLGWAAKAWIQLSAIRSESPLIQCITNFVSMDLMANTLLSAGASPAMIHNVEEIPDFTPHAHALCINVGTLSPDWLSGMKLAAKFASDSGKPWVLDPVAAGASGFRLKSCLELVELKPTVIRGNASESFV